VLAARVAGGTTSGDYLLQRELRVGGTGEGEFLGIESRHFPVRGYETSTLRGHRAALGSLEYRLPIWNIDRGPATLPIFFERIVGAAFVDAGTAWQRGGGRRTIASLGAELGADLFLLYGSPLRYRIGFAYRLSDPDRGKVQPYISFGTAF
jgi:outer membrane protein assembly factor BamA